MLLRIARKPLGCKSWGGERNLLLLDTPEEVLLEDWKISVNRII